MKQTDLSKQSVNFGAGGLRNSLKSIQKSPMPKEEDKENIESKNE